MKKFFLALLLLPAPSQAASYETLYEDAVLVRANKNYIFDIEKYENLYKDYGHILSDNIGERRRVAETIILPVITDLALWAEEVYPQLKSPEMKEVFVQMYTASTSARDAWKDVLLMLDTRELRKEASIQMRLDESERLMNRYIKDVRKLVRSLKKEMRYNKEPKEKFKKL